MGKPPKKISDESEHPSDNTSDKENRKYAQN